MKKNILFIVMAGFLLVGSASAGIITSPEPNFYTNRNGVIPPKLVEIQGAEPVGNQICFKCHPLIKSETEVSQDIWQMDVHSKITGTAQCESCHGNGSKHIKANNASYILNPAAFSKADQDALCQACHLQGQALFHGTANVSCLDCHMVHTEKNPMMLKKLPERELCYQCHARQRAEFDMYSHHPVNEGLMSCTDCHAAHFSSRLDSENGAPQILGNRQSIEACGKCHPAEAGPFVVSPSSLEGCLGCHKPHGSVVDNLQLIPQPALCMKCHEPSSHQFAMLSTVCTECHMDIHGSDHNRQLFN